MDARDPRSGASAEVVVERSRACNIQTTIVSPLAGLFPTGIWGKGGPDAFAANIETAKACVENNGALLQWAVVNPNQPETYAQAAELLAAPGGRCCGLKIHPGACYPLRSVPTIWNCKIQLKYSWVAAGYYLVECHCYHIADKGEELFEFARKHKALVMCHSGHSNSHPMDYLPFCDASPEIHIILAHLGNSGDIEGAKDPTHHVQAIAASKHGNVHVDTSSAAGIQPHLLEYAVSKVGAEKILFGTDTPLYFAAMQRARVDSAELPDEAKRLILRGNAERLLGRKL